MPGHRIFLPPLKPEQTTYGKVVRLTQKVPLPPIGQSPQRTAPISPTRQDQSLAPLPSLVVTLAPHQPVAVAHETASSRFRKKIKTACEVRPIPPAETDHSDELKALNLAMCSDDTDVQNDSNGNISAPHRPLAHPPSQRSKSQENHDELRASAQFVSRGINAWLTAQAMGHGRPDAPVPSFTARRDRVVAWDEPNASTHDTVQETSSMYALLLTARPPSARNRTHDRYEAATPNSTLPF